MVVDRLSLHEEVGGRRVITVPEAGRILGLGRTASYEAVRAGEIPAIRIRGRVVVPVAQLERLLTGRWNGPEGANDVS